MRSLWCETSNNLYDFRMHVVHTLHNAEFSGHLLCDPAFSFLGKFVAVSSANLLCWPRYTLFLSFLCKRSSLQNNKDFSQLYYYIITDRAISFVLAQSWQTTCWNLSGKRLWNVFEKPSWKRPKGGRLSIFIWKEESGWDSWALSPHTFTSCFLSLLIIHW